MKKLLLLSHSFRGKAEAIFFLISLLALSKDLFSQNIGIGTTTPGAKLHVVSGSSGYSSSFFFAGIALEGSGNTYLNILVPNSSEAGLLFGKPSNAAEGGIVYNSGATANGLQFRTNGNATRMVINQSGNIGIGTTTPGFPLNFASSVGDKISLYGNNGAHYGLGIQSALLQIYTDGPGSNIAFGHGSSNSFNERMRILNDNGSYDGMILSGRLLIKNGSTDMVYGGGGVWLYKADNSVLLSFMGTQNNQNVGFYGGPVNGGWGFVYDAINSRVGIGTSLPSTSLEVNGYSKFGSDAPSIKMKILTGTTSDTEGSFVYIYHGLTPSKILSITVMVSDEPDYWVGPSYGITGYNFRWSLNSAAISVWNFTGSSAHILSKPIKIFITYEE